MHDQLREAPGQDWLDEDQQSAQQAARGAALSEYQKAINGQPDKTPAIELDDRITRPTGEVGGTPDGEPTRIGRREDDEVRRSLSAENNGAVILAAKGAYQIKQNPSADEIARSRLESGDTGSASAEPDYLIEGRVFDCYAPSANKSVRGIWSEVNDKVESGQTQRVVLHLEDWRGDMSHLHRQFDSWPIDNVKEVKAIAPDGGIVQIVPNVRND